MHDGSEFKYSALTSIFGYTDKRKETTIMMAAEFLWIFNIFITTISITIAHKGTVNFLVHSFKIDSRTNQVYDTAIMNMDQSNSNIEFQFRRADDSFFSWTVFFEKV